MNLKMKNIVKGNAFAILSGAIVFASCSKEVTRSNVQNEASVSSVQSPALISDSAAIKFFKGSFSCRGSRTDYRGSVTDTTATISLDYFLEKKFTPAAQNRLLLNYADGGLSSKGWKYVVTIDKRTGNISLAPNDIMAAEIIPGSFNVVYVAFDKYNRTFNFLTEAKEAKNNIVHQVNEIITRQ
jgi:hypothetical protein